MKKTVKWTGVILLTPILLFFLLALLFYFPPFQNWAVRQVASYASHATGMQIRVEHVNLEFPLDLGVSGVMVLQPNDSLPTRTDTIADIRHLVADVQLLPLFGGKVEVDELRLENVKVNTAGIIHTLRIKGAVGLLALKAHPIDLGKSLVNVDEAQIENSSISLELADTVPPDTTPSENFWKINLRKVAVNNTAFTLHMPGDTLQVGTFMTKAKVDDICLDLHESLYKISHIDWRGGYVHYDNNFMPHAEGMDFNHLALNSLTLVADKFSYGDAGLSVDIRQCQFKERSGLDLRQLHGTFAMDSTSISLPKMTLRTSESSLTAQVNMDLNAFDETLPGKLNATLHGTIGKQDLLRIVPIPADMARKLPYLPLSVDGTVGGNMKKMHLSKVSLRWPTAFDVKADGFVENLDDTDRLKADLDLDAYGYNLDFITAMLPRSVTSTVNIPQGLGVKGHFRVNGQSYGGNFMARQSGGTLRGNVKLNAANMTYAAHLTANALPLQHFLPNMGLNDFSGTIDAQGAGTDFMSPRTYLTATAHIQKFKYGAYNLDSITAEAHVSGGRLHADIDSKNALAKGTVSFDGTTNGKRMSGTIVCDLSDTDLKQLGITDEAVRAALCGQLDVNTDFKDYYKVQGTVGDLCITEGKKIYRPDDIGIDLLTSRDTTHAVVDCGDFNLRANAKGGYEVIMNQIAQIQTELDKQWHDKYIDQRSLRKNLPNASVYINTGNDNFFCDILRHYGYDFADLNMDLTSSNVSGLNGNVYVNSLVIDSIQLDTVRLRVASGDSTMAYHVQVRNNEHNPDYVFNALLDGELRNRDTSVGAKIYDANNKLGVRLGLTAAMESNGIRLSMMGDDPVLGYKTFSVNDNNYVFLRDDNHISADLKLLAADGMGVQIYSNDDNQDALQDITVSLNKFDLEKVLSVIPYTPSIGGMLNGDFHVIKTTEELSVASDVTVDGMSYEHCEMGNIGSQFVYMPKSDGSHYVDGVLLHEGSEVGTLQGTYKSEGDGYLDATFSMNRLPMMLVNGFIPDRLFGLRGYGEGSLSIVGSLSKPQVNGEVYLDSTYIYSEPYGVEMRFANDPVRIVNSQLLFENFEMFANNDQPLDISGNFDFSDLNRMMLDVRMRAENFEIIDAKENPRSEVYGKAFVNFFGFMRGPVESLKLRGQLDLLGNTDMTYVMRDAELTSDNQLQELVKFTNLQDTTEDVVDRPPLTGLDMALNISADESAHIMCMLNADHSNYIDLMGGGDLLMRYTEVDGVKLTGRYTLYNGEMKYSLPIIPLRTFTIQDGSYIEFQGDPMDPSLHITATERVKATVNEGTGSGRSVDFDCGVKLSQTLNNLGIEFIIDAPNDMSVQDELNTMTKEGRSKVAITMLASGIYLTDGNTSSFSMNSALSSFLSNEINNVAGTAMKSMGLEIGMSVDNSTTSSGALHTDYNFKFSKRLWNNRLSVIVGGKVSTGAEIENERENSFFSNFELQYRLNQKSSQYLRLFYNNNKYDWLEGMIGEYGAGFMWRRKLQHFKDIFKFKSEKQQPVPPAKSDTLRNHNITIGHEEN